MQIHFYIALIHIQGFLHLCITQSLNVPHDDDAAEWLIEILDSRLQALPEICLINLYIAVVVRRLLFHVCIFINILTDCLASSLMIDYRVMRHSHQPRRKLCMINLLPVLPELDEHLLVDILGINRLPQAIVRKRIDAFPVLRYGLLVLF